MKIAFDGQPLLNANKTGIAYYEDGLVKGMLNCKKNILIN